MARTDYGAILSTVIKDTSDSIREVERSNALIAPNEWGTHIRGMMNKQDYIDSLSTNKVSGSVVTFTDGAEDVPVKSLKVAITGHQSGSGTPSPENIMPITAWSGAVVSRTGKNLLNPNATVINAYIGGRSNIVAHASNRTVILPCSPNTTYTYTWNRKVISGGDNSLVASFTSEPTFGSVGTTLATITSAGGNATFTTGASDTYLAIKYANISNTTPQDTLNDSQLELGSTATAYEPFVGNTYTIPFGQQVFKGELDVTTGLLRVDKAIVDLGDLNYTKYDVAEGTLFRTQISGAKLTYNVDNLLCSIYHFATKEQRTNGTYSIPDNVGNIDFINNSYTSASDFKTAMAGQKLVYELATPQEIQLTPAEVDTLLGYNTIFCDTGDILECEYRIDKDMMYQEGLQKNTIENVPIASFNALSGVKLDSLKVLVEAQQDLHGYDKPWAGGGGKNIVPLTISNIKSANTSGTWVNNVYTHNGMAFSIETDEAGNVIGIKANGTASGGSSILRLGNFELPANTYAINGLSHEGSQSTFRIILTNSSYSTAFSVVTLVSDTLYQAIERTYGLQIVISNGIQMSNEMFYPMVRLSSISDSTFAPYSNICPITGWSGANVTRTGSKNILDPNATVFGNYTISPDGSHNEATDRLATHYLRCKGNTSYKAISDKKITSYTYAFLDIAFYDENLNYICRSYTNNTNNSFTFTTPANAKFLVYSEQFSGLSNVTPAVFETYDRCLVEGNIDSYEPFVGNTYTISFGDTYYGGELDVTNGVLRVDRALFDLGSVNYTFNSTHGFFYTNMPANSADNIIGGRAGMSDIYELYQGNLAGFKLTDSTFTYNNSSIGGAKTIGIRDTYTTDPDVFKTRVTGHYVIYELATPFTVQLTPTQIEQLEENNIWADTGDVSECKYYASVSEPQYDITQICDNSSYSSTLTLTDSYSNYDFLKIVIYNSNDSKEYTIFTIPSVLDQIATYGNNLVNFNTVMETNIYCAYTMTSSSTWTRYGNRNSNIKAIYGYKATNKTVSVTPIYARQNITTSSVTPTSTTSLYDYDLIFLATCSGAVDETQPCNNVIYPKGKFNGIPHYFILNKYLGATCVAMTEFTLGANSNYFGVYGIKFE